MMQGIRTTKGKERAVCSMVCPDKGAPRQMSSKRRICLFLVCTILFLIANPVAAIPTDTAEITANVAPILIGDEAVSQISAYGVQISWITSIPSNSWVYYDTVSHPNANEYAWVIKDDIYTTIHCLFLSNLQPGTVYHFRVRSDGPDGVTLVSGDMTFTTLSLPPTSGGGGRSYRYPFVTLPSASPITGVPTPPEITPSPQYVLDSGNVTPIFTLIEIVLDTEWLSFITLIIPAIIVIFLYRRRKKED